MSEPSWRGDCLSGQAFPCFLPWRFRSRMWRLSFVRSSSGLCGRRGDVLVCLGCDEPVSEFPGATGLLACGGVGGLPCNSAFRHVRYAARLRLSFLGRAQRPGCAGSMGKAEADQGKRRRGGRKGPFRVPSSGSSGDQGPTRYGGGRTAGHGAQGQGGFSCVSLSAPERRVAYAGLSMSPLIAPVEISRGPSGLQQAGRCSFACGWGGAVCAPAGSGCLDHGGDLAPAGGEIRQQRVSSSLTGRISGCVRPRRTCDHLGGDIDGIVPWRVCRAHWQGRPAPVRLGLTTDAPWGRPILATARLAQRRHSREPPVASIPMICGARAAASVRPGAGDAIGIARHVEPFVTPMHMTSSDLSRRRYRPRGQWLPLFPILAQTGSYGGPSDCSGSMERRARTQALQRARYPLEGHRSHSSPHQPLGTAKPETTRFQVYTRGWG